MIASLLLLALALPVALCAGYLALLTVLSARPRRSGWARRPATRFTVLVPAHDEERGIRRTVEQLRSLRYPRSLFRVVVVADNCTDRTAQEAASAGATVWERKDPAQRGKGFALEWAFARCVADGLSDAVVVVDADSVVSRGMLTAFARRIARGESAIQADYRVLNPGESWRTELLSLAFTLFHRVRSRGRERLGLSCGLRGNGMCFTVDLLKAHPHRAHSIVEDVEFGLQLGLSGTRVAYADDAVVFGEMPATEGAAKSQRQRWEGGRSGLRRLAAEAVRRGVARRSAMVAELGMDLLVPPLGTLAVAAALLFVVASAALVAFGWGLAAWALSTAALFALSAYVLRGLALNGRGRSTLAALAKAPGYVWWKIALKLRAKRPPTEWVRTARGGGAST